MKYGISIAGTVLVIAAVLGAWFASHSTAAHERQCMSAVSPIRSTLEQTGAIDARGAAYLTDERIKTALKPYCREAARNSRAGSRTPLCELGLDAELVSSSDLRFMTGAERHRFKRDECKYRRAYMARDSVSIDLGGIAADHPAHYVPLCASQLLSSFSNDRGAVAYTRRELRTIARRSCLAGLQTRVLDATGPGGFNSCSVDERRWTALIRRVAQDVRSA